MRPDELGTAEEDDLEAEAFVEVDEAATGVICGGVGNRDFPPPLPSLPLLMVSPVDYRRPLISDARRFL